jgi:hypothetical protein
VKLARVLALVAMAAAPAVAQAAAGHVLFALGRVEIQRNGQPLAATRGTQVEVGDTIATGPTGMAQVRLKDGALLSLRYGSTMKVEEFRMPDPAPMAPPLTGTPVATAAAPAVSGGNGRSVFRLLRGAFRTVTGLIGKGANDAYRVVTPVATIGIRGTDYSAAYCSGDCGATPDGLYVGVSSGEIELNNDGGQLVLGNDQYGSVKDASTPPEQELAPPEVLETPIAAGEGEDSADEGASESAPSGDSPPDAGAGAEAAAKSGSEVVAAQPEGEYELLPGRPGSFAFAKGGASGSGSNGVYTDGNGGLIGFLSGTLVSIGSAQNVNRGSDSLTGLQWGRWSGGTASIGGASLDLSQQSLHWIYAENSTAPVLPISGTMSYSMVGGTNPTDTAGYVGQLVDATLTANFQTGAVASTLHIIGINDTVWVANSTSGSIASGTPLFSGVYAVQVNDAVGTPIDTTGTGTFGGFFTSNAAAAGLTYDLSGAGTNVSGAAALEGSPP